MSIIIDKSRAFYSITYRGLTGELSFSKSGILQTSILVGKVIKNYIQFDNGEYSDIYESYGSIPTILYNGNSQVCNHLVDQTSGNNWETMEFYYLIFLYPSDERTAIKTTNLMEDSIFFLSNVNLDSSVYFLPKYYLFNESIDTITALSSDLKTLNVFAVYGYLK